MDDVVRLQCRSANRKVKMIFAREPVSLYSRTHILLTKLFPRSEASMDEIFTAAPTLVWVPCLEMSCITDRSILRMTRYYAKAIEQTRGA